MSESEYDSVTEGSYCESKDVPVDAIAATAEIETAICETCGNLRVFLTLTTEEGVRVVHTFDQVNGALFATALMTGSLACADYEKAFGKPMNLN